MNHILAACLMLVLAINAAEAMAASKPDAGSNHSHRAVQQANAKASGRQTPTSRPAAKVHARANQSAAKPRHQTGQVLRSGAPKPLLIAIDAGHGGKDTGAIGPNGTLEKRVVYAVARKLRKLIKAEPGMSPLMVRKGDTYISPRRRAEIAGRAGADLLVSLHADAYAREDARGFSVFTLLPRRTGAERFPQGTLRVSNRAARRVLVEMRKTHPLHCRQVKKARYAVLKSREVPSMLIETGFISNPREEKRLANPAYQEKLARSIFNGLRAYARAAEPQPARTIAARPMVMAYRQ